MSHEYTVTGSAEILPTNSTADIEVELLQQATRSSPPRLRLSLVNRLYRLQQFDFGYTPPLSSYVLTAGDRDSTLILVPPDYSGCPNKTCIASSRSDHCWTAKGTPETLETGTLIDLNPNDEVEREYILLNHPENASCFPSGRYSTVDTIGIGNSKYDIEFVSDVERSD